MRKGGEPPFLPWDAARAGRRTRLRVESPLALPLPGSLPANFLLSICAACANMEGRKSRQHLAKGPWQCFNKADWEAAIIKPYGKKLERSCFGLWAIRRIYERQQAQRLGRREKYVFLGGLPGYGRCRKNRCFQSPNIRTFQNNFNISRIFPGAGRFGLAAADVWLKRGTKRKTYFSSRSAFGQLSFSIEKHEPKMEVSYEPRNNFGVGFWRAV